ncbi:MAG: hypothetical protein SFW09_01625 [Hyphomicrobiaceae bacterium]|nr:hypothetical protein [Hyphomicrobiaceae bacterium]
MQPATHAVDAWWQGPPSDWLEQAVSIVGAATLALAIGPIMMATPDDASRTRGQAPPLAGGEIAAAETIAAFYSGITHTHSSDVKFSKPGGTDLTAHEVGWIGRPFKSPIYYGLRGIRWPEAGRIGGMVDFTHAKAISIREQSVRFTGTRNGKPADGAAKVGDTFRHLEFSHGHNMLTVNGLLRLGALTATVRPYVGGGLGVSLPHTEVQFLDDAKRTYEYQLTGGVGQALVGVELRLPRVSVFVEYKFSLAPYRVPLSGLDGGKHNAFLDFWGQLTRWWRGEEPEMGRLATNLATHHLIGGVGYRYEAAPAAR